MFRTLMEIVAALLFSPLIVASIAFGTVITAEGLDLYWLLGYLIAINIVAFLWYTYDKIARGVLDWTKILDWLPLFVPNVCLIWLLAFPGGTVGAIGAMLLLSHMTGAKTREFRIQLLFALALQFAIIVALTVATLVFDQDAFSSLNDAIGALAIGVVDLTDQLLVALGLL